MVGILHFVAFEEKAFCLPNLTLRTEVLLLLLQISSFLCLYILLVSPLHPNFHLRTARKRKNKKRNCEKKKKRNKRNSWGGWMRLRIGSQKRDGEGKKNKNRKLQRRNSEADVSISSKTTQCIVFKGLKK